MWAGKRGTYPPSGWLLTDSRTPLFSVAHGTSAYAYNKFNALPNSLFAFLSSSLRRTGRGLKREDMVTVVPRCTCDHYAKKDVWKCYIPVLQLLNLNF